MRCNVKESPTHNRPRLVRRFPKASLLIGTSLAVLGWLTANYLGGLSTVRQLQRVPNSDRTLDAIEYTVQDLSTTPAYLDIAIVPRGKPLSPSRWAVSSTDSIRSNREHGYDLKWVGLDTLEVSHWEGNVDIEKDFKAGPWPWSRHVTIVTKREYPPGVSDFVDPPSQH